MSENQPVSRRLAVAGLGAGSLGLFMTAHGAAMQTRANRETGGAGPGDSAALSMPAFSTMDHPLAGLWLSTVGLPSNPDMTVAVPSFFGADGSVMLCFPGTEAAEHGVQVKGPAMGSWEVVDERTGHFTVVQVLSDINGGYVGTVTVDGYPSIDDDGSHYIVDTERNLFTMRDHLNAIVAELGGSASNPMQGYRMRPGNPGFPVQTLDTVPTRVERRTPD